MRMFKPCKNKENDIEKTNWYENSSQKKHTFNEKIKTQHIFVHTSPIDQQNWIVKLKIAINVLFLQNINFVLSWNPSIVVISLCLLFICYLGLYIYSNHSVDGDRNLMLLFIKLLLYGDWLMESNNWDYLSWYIQGKCAQEGLMFRVS